MREIKFRAWDKIGKEMFRVIMLSFPVGEKRIIVSGRGGSTDTENDDCILMQFTGLKDKNGKEIYEGDICKFYSYMERKEKSAEVLFIEGCFELKNSELVNEVMGEKIGIEIIGNIYENPELLKGL